MKAAHVSNPGADVTTVEREIPEPGAKHVRITVHACGVCHTEVVTKERSWPGIQYPRVAPFNDLPISESDRKYHWPLGRRSADHPELSGPWF